MSCERCDARSIARILGRGREQKVDRPNPTWLTFCPAHNDRNRPSLLVADGDRTVVFHCYAGCAQDRVLDALRDHHNVVPARFDGSVGTPRNKVKTAAKIDEPTPKAATPEEWWSGHGLPMPPTDRDIPCPPGHHETGRWAWRNEAGEIILWNVRFEKDGEKTFVPMSVWTNGKKEYWTKKNVATPRPLYDLHLRDVAEDVLILEGEKTTEAAKRLFPGFWHTTCGANTSVGRTDLAPLLGRRVVVATDMDGPGLLYASAIADLSPASSVEILRIPAVFNPAEGDDLADLFQRGVTAEQFISALRDSEGTALVKLR